MIFINLFSKRLCRLYFVNCLLLILICFVSACTNTKNTAVTRAFHNTTSYYNVYFNANEYYQAGILKIKNSDPLDYSSLIPVFIEDVPRASQIAKSDMESCIQKCGKNILNHSITKKPKKKYGSSGMNNSDQSFYDKPDYCKYIDDSYLLMGKADFVEGEIDRAESSFRLVTTRFKHEPSKFEAQLWLARTLKKQGSVAEALELLNKLNKDLRHPEKLDGDIFKAYADIYIFQRDYPAALENIIKAAELQKKKKDRAYLYYIAAELNRLIGNPAQSSLYYNKVIKINPDFSMVFNAKINLATVSTSEYDTEKSRKTLLKMLEDQNNDDYRDAIYYALAEMQRRQGNSDEALSLFKKSARLSTKNDIQKAKSYLAAADICFDKEDYLSAASFYDSAMVSLPKTYDDYDNIALKTKYLKQLAANVSAARDQDSLRRVASLPEDQRNALIQKIIDDVVKREQQKQMADLAPYSGGDNAYSVTNYGTDGNPAFTGKWYLYNTQALNYGKTEFQKKWGKRVLADDWRRKIKSEVVDDPQEQKSPQDSVSSSVDNKNPLFYTRNLPLSDSAKIASVNSEAEYRFAAADDYSSKMNNNEKAIESLLYIVNHLNTSFITPQAYYNLYLLYNKVNNFDRAEYFKSQLISNYPDNIYSKILENPDFLKNVENHRQDGLNAYNIALNYFKNEDYASAVEKCTQGEIAFADLQIIENFRYLEALAHGRMHNTDAMRTKLEKFLEDFPRSSLVESARAKLDALKTGSFDVQRFVTDFDSAHYFWIVFNNDDQASKSLMFDVQLFCGDKGYSSMDVGKISLGASASAITVSFFSDSQKAMDFYRAFKVTVSSTSSLMFVVNKSNIKLISAYSDAQAYYNFFLINYK